jgi:hypothetical protein
MRFGTALCLGVAIAAGCGGSIGDVTDDVDASGGTGGSIIVGGSGGSAGTGGKPVKDSGSDAKDAGKDAKSDAKDATGDYVEDLNCPDVEPPPPTRECDPFSTPSGCPAGDGCYPFVDYPTGPCDKEEYGTVCYPPGYGQQGEPCGGGLCASGFVCVITGQGNQCVELCPLTGQDDCPAGLVCVPIDVEGFGGCF